MQYVSNSMEIWMPILHSFNFFKTRIYLEERFFIFMYIYSVNIKVGILITVRLAIVYLKYWYKQKLDFLAAFLVKYLEQRSCDLDLNTKWVFLLLLDIGVSPLKLMEIYDRLFKSRVCIFIFNWFVIRFYHACLYMKN